MAMNLVRKPVLEAAKLSLTEIRIERLTTQVLAGLFHELGREQIAKGVRGEIAKPPEAPVNVLQTTSGIVGRCQVQELAKVCIPGLGQVGWLQVARNQSLFEFKAKNDVKIVSHLVRLDADERSLHIVDGKQKVVDANVSQRRWKRLPRLGNEALPERPPSTDLVFPQA